MTSNVSPIETVAGTKKMCAGSVLLVDPLHCCLIVSLVLDVVVAILVRSWNGGASVLSTRAW